MAKKRNRKRSTQTKRTHASAPKTSQSDQPWLNREIVFLKEGYQPQRAVAIARTLARPVSSVREKAAELTVCHQRPWTEWDLQYFQDHYDVMSLCELANHLARKIVGVKGMAHRLMVQDRLARKRPALPRWTSREVALLKRNKHMSLPTLAQKLSRTEVAIREKLRSLELYEPSRTCWTPDECTFIQANYPHMTIQEIGTRLGRSRAAVDTQARRMGLRKGPSPKPWKDSEIAYLKKKMHDPKYHPLHRELAEHLGRTVESVTRKIRQLGLSIPLKNRIWTEQEVRYLKKHYARKTYREIGDHLGRTASAVEKAMYRLGLRKRSEDTQGKPVPWHAKENRGLVSSY